MRLMTRSRFVTVEVGDRVKAKGKVTKEEKAKESRGQRMLVFCAAVTN